MKNTNKLIEYLSNKLHSIYEIYADFENNLTKTKINLVKSTLSQKDIGQAYYRLEYIEGNLFRQAMLIMVCSYLEEAMNLIGEQTMSDYAAKISKKTNENWFKKRKRLFNDAGISFKGVEEECDRINDLRIVRNCIVHGGGSIKKCQNPGQVEKAIKKLNERDKDKNMNLVDIFIFCADKFLYLGDNIIATAIIASEEIIKHCSKGEPSKD